VNLVSPEPRDSAMGVAAWAGIRTILVPPDIVAVRRLSPAPSRTRTPWRQTRDGEATTERAGSREWFSDRLFVEAQDGHHRAGYGSSVAVHVGLAIGLIVVLISRPVTMLRINGPSSMVMPATLSVMPILDAPLPDSRVVERTPPPRPVPRPSMAPSPPPAGVSIAAPIEPPAGIAPETGAESGMDGPEYGTVGGVEGGVAGSVVGGTAALGPASSGPLRPGISIQPPRKIKDVMPVYPQSGLADQTRGTVVIEATIGADGRVTGARVLHSVPALDQAALAAVRQWEYVPSILNGLPVAVIMIVIVNFAIQ
jgi:periplasmic protein TonB